VDFFARQDASERATRYLVLLFGLAFLAVGLATGIVLLVLLGFAGDTASIATSGAGLGGLLAANLEILAAVIAAVVGLMILASLFRAATLSRGGGQVARMLGGTQIQSDDQDPLHRRLINVVEEMSIASGLPVPEVYVLEQERGINAFAAGLTPADAAVAVTRGSLEQLSRAELQAVIAHEFSHILNGDMRLNLRLMGFSFGILVLALVGRWLLRASSRGLRMNVGRRKGSPAIMIGLALTVIGGIGVVLSRLIKAAVSRQREVLADASAVQFTREPLALAGALKKIGGFTPYLETVNAEEVSHMLFGRAGRSFAGLFATHPPLDQRIQALDPSFRPGEYILPAAPALTRAAADGEAGINRLSAGGATIDLAAAGTIEPEAGGLLHAAIPADLHDAVHSRESSYLLVLALALEPGGGSPAQRRILENRLGPARTLRCRRLREAIEALDARLRLPLFELAVPALKQRPPEQIEYLFELVERLVAADDKLTLSEFLLQRLLRAHFEQLGQARAHEPAGGKRDRGEALRMLLSTLATAGNPDPAAARAALAAGLAAIGLADAPGAGVRSRRDAAEGYAELDRALTSLARAPLKLRRAALAALAVTMRHDSETTVAEAELYRTIAAVLGCPIPPARAIG
jgi:Zn-dependent protease with chaperone function